ncbi:MAG TPA: efflux RND transporter periplasmic adaptor subunit [Gemmatimonadaceae bacterium]|nr:efflux RND transporter periplasmic adaptor subunit [Gemmatimonadaceae bacterium]
MTREGTTPWRRYLRFASMAALPVLATAIAVFATRTDSTARAGQGHDHSRTAAQESRPVMLAGDAAQRIGVTYAVVVEEALSREIRAVGQISVDETRVKLISPKVDGWVERLYVNATGQEIAVGQPMMAVYSPMVSAAQEELLLAKQLQLRMSGSDSAARLHAASLLAAARGRLSAWDVSDSDIARVEGAARAERTLTLRSPVAGFVVEKNVVQGQRIMAGDVLYRVVDLSRVWLEGEVYEQDMAAVRVGQRASAELQALPELPVSGRVAYVYPTINTETRTVRVRIELPNPGHRLKPGMVATLHLTGSTNARALTIPRAAVLSTGERHLVFVKRRDGMLEPHAVQIGRATDDRIEILRGVARGDTVVASATFLVDAESSLGTALGGMGNMPGMDIAPPKKRD